MTGIVFSVWYELSTCLLAALTASAMVPAPVENSLLNTAFAVSVRSSRMHSLTACKKNYEGKSDELPEMILNYSSCLHSFCSSTVVREVIQSSVNSEYQPNLENVIASEEIQVFMSSKLTK